MTVRNHSKRLGLLEAGLPQPGPELPWRGWCSPDGASCTPPDDVRRRVEGTARGPWRAAIHVPDQGLVLRLHDERYEFQVVELDDRWAAQRAAYGVTLSPDSA